MNYTDGGVNKVVNDVNGVNDAAAVRLKSAAPPRRRWATAADEDKIMDAVMSTAIAEMIVEAGAPMKVAFAAVEMASAELLEEAHSYFTDMGVPRFVDPRGDCEIASCQVHASELEGARQ